MFDLTDFANKLLRDMARAQVPPQPEDDKPQPDTTQPESKETA